MLEHHKIDYVEFSSPNPDATRSFFASVFGWQFEEFKNYLAFHGAGLEGGIYRSEQVGRVDSGRPLVVFYSLDIAASERLVCQHGATVVTPLLPSRAGRDFTSPSRQEMNSPSGATFSSLRMTVWPMIVWLGGKPVIIEPAGQNQI